jgi:hypothetical protein
MFRDVDDPRPERVRLGRDAASPGPNSASSTSRVGVVKTVLAEPRKYLRAAASAARRGPKPIGTSIPITSTSWISSKRALTDGIKHAEENRPSAKTTATQPALVPSTPATRTR